MNILTGAGSFEHPIQGHGGHADARLLHSWLYCLRHCQGLSFEAGYRLISDLIWLIWNEAKSNLRFILTHNPHGVTKTNKVSTQIIPTMFSWYRLKTYNFRAQLPLLIFDLNPVGRQPKERPLRIICHPSIARCRNFTRCLLWESVSRTRISFLPV